MGIYTALCIIASKYVVFTDDTYMDTGGVKKKSFSNLETNIYIYYTVVKFNDFIIHIY